MKALRLMLTVTSISLICILCCSLVSALNPNEASVRLFWASQPVKVGDRVSVWIAFESECAEQLEIYYVGINFDWMATDGFYGFDLSADPVTIPSYGTHTFDPMTVQIPSNISAGAHRYFIGIEGTQGSLASSFSWNSSISTIQIYVSDEKVYSDLLSQVMSKLNEAVSANYESAEAQSLLQQAQSAFVNATSSANDGKWSIAIENLEIADGFLDQANEAEQRSDEQRAALQNLLVYVAIIAIVVIIVVSIIVVVVRRRRKQTDSGADQPVETIEEQSEEQG